MYKNTNLWKDVKMSLVFSDDFWNEYSQRSIKYKAFAWPYIDHTQCNLHYDKLQGKSMSSVGTEKAYTRSIWCSNFLKRRGYEYYLTEQAKFYLNEIF